MNNLFGLILISIGVVLDLFACIALARFQDIYSRLAIVTKLVTVGTSSILFGTFLMVGFTPAGMKALLCMLFILITSPVTAHAMARGAHKSGIKLCAENAIDKYTEDGGK